MATKATSVKNLSEKAAISTKKPVSVKVKPSKAVEVKTTAQPVGVKTMVNNFEQIKENTAKVFTESMDKFNVSLAEVNAASQANLDAVLTSSQILGKGAQEVATLSATYAKGAFERGVEVAKTIGSAKSIQEVVEFQADFAKKAFDTFMNDFNKIAEVVASTSKDAVKPVSERTSALVSKFQNAAQ